MFVENKKGENAFVTGLIIFVCIIFLIASYVIFPIYNVWEKELSGKAKLKESEWSKKIQIEQAKGERAASILKAETKIELETANAKSEIIRANGVAEANQIIGSSLKDNDEYLTYLWIQGLQDGSSEVIYIPTEANLPLLEARNKK